MKRFILGLVIGLVIGGGVAFAASRIVLVNGTGNEIGNTSNPVYVSFS
jgi:hypothetical protein